MEACVVNTSIAVVVLNYGAPDHTLECLDALTHVPCDGVYCLDNGSSDSSRKPITHWADQLGHAIPWPFRFWTIENNIGYAAAHNLVLDELLKKHDIQYCWLLNNDTIPNANSLAAMQNQMDEDTGVAASTLIQPSGEVQCVGGYRYNRFSSIMTAAKTGQSLDYFCAASVLIRLDALRQVGIFDSRYFLYGEELDLSVRLKQAGWSIRQAPESVVEHKLGATIKSAASGDSTSGSALANLHENLSVFRFTYKNYPWALLTVIPCRIVMKLIAAVMYSRWRAFGAVFTALNEFFRNPAGPKWRDEGTVQVFEWSKP